LSEMRTFIAVDLSEEVRRSVAEVISRLRERITNVRWSAPENVHITLRFLGEVPEGELPKVLEAARAAASASEPFVLQAGGASGFGGKNPRVLFLEVEGEVSLLKKLQERLEDELDQRGFGREGRAFAPHLTLGRRKGGPLPADWADFKVPEPRDWEVEQLVVYASKLTREGPIYTALARFDLTCQGKGTGARMPKQGQ